MRRLQKNIPPQKKLLLHVIPHFHTSSKISMLTSIRFHIFFQRTKKSYAFLHRIKSDKKYSRCLSCALACFESVYKTRT